MCTCREGNATWDFLNAPVAPPEDEIHCPLGRATRGGCPRKIPEGWDRTCYDNGKLECFLRRHAASWQIACSERLRGTCDCRSPHPEWCPRCGKDGAPWGEEDLETIRRQVEIEKRTLGRGRDRFTLLKSPHFYLLTDIRSMKVRTRSGSFRLVRQHELAHLYVQRAEIAYQDFVRAFGDRLMLEGPSAIFLMKDKDTAEILQAAYFGNRLTQIRYGGGSGAISGGLPFNGISFSMEGSGSEDRDLHLKMRHGIGHLLMSCYLRVAPNPPELPAWIHAGAGHWLARLPEKLRERATFCSSEAAPIQHSGKKWDQKILKYLSSAKPVPIQRILDADELVHLDLEMHIKAWSWFDIWLREDPERFVRFIQGVRLGKSPRVAMKEGLGISPEEFEQRWKDRILDRRPSVAPTTAELDASDPSRPGAKERALIRAETDLRTLASRVKALQAVNDPLTAATVVPLLDKTPSEGVREAVVHVLAKTTSPRVRKWLRTEGLSGHAGVARATVARVIGDLRDAEAAPARAAWADLGVWGTRAHVARALGLMGHEPSVPLLKEMLGDESDKVRIAVLDALGRFGEKAGSAWEPAAALLDSTKWQVRSAAAECLGNLGRMEACEALIARMEMEKGRIRKDIRKALRVLTRDDLGEKPENWRKWWDRLKEKYPGAAPPRGEKPKEPPKGEIEYAEVPTYYGLRVFSKGVGYVLDVSGSMVHAVELDPGWMKRNRRTYAARATKFDLARHEIEASLAALDPRVRFNLYFFRTRAFAWKNGLVPASPGNRKAAASRMASEVPQQSGKSRPGRSSRPDAQQNLTNYVDVFRLVLDVKPEQALGGGFGDTPDTIFFLTDGTPTAGDITDTDVLVSWFNELNRFARIRVNVITFGLLGVDPVFLRRLAEENGGVFIRVPTAK